MSEEYSNQSFLLAKEVYSQSEELFNRLKINGFSYSRVFTDGSRAELWSDPEALYHTFVSKRYIADSYTPDNYKRDERYVFLPDKIATYPSTVKENYLNQLMDQRNIFNHDNAFMIINREILICEYFIFYTDPQSLSRINIYISNLEYLENFIRRFKEQSQHLIEKVDKDRIIKPWRKLTKNNQVICQAANSRRNKACKLVFLTNREKQVAQHIIERMTAKESALSLGISVRTVESYIENIKSKLGSKRKSDLLVDLIEHKQIIW